jgi:hypothetical protein
VRVPLGLELIRLSFFLHLCAPSLYVSSGILPMSPPDAQGFIVYFSNNEHVCSPLPFPSCSTKPWKWGGKGWGSLICCLWYPFNGLASPVYMSFPLPRCLSHSNLGGANPGATHMCARIKSHTYDDSWYITNVTSLLYNRSSVQNN